MKKLLGTAIQFSGLTTLIYLIGFAMLFFISINEIPLIYRTTNALSWEGGGTYQRFQDFEPDKQYDVVFLGSSRARQAYDPRVFQKVGLDSYNLGSSAQNLIQSHIIAREYLTTTNTNLLILDVFEGVLKNKGVESISDLIQNLTSDKAALQVAWAMKDIRAINMLVLRWFSKLRSPIYESDTYVGAGFEQKIDSVQAEIEYPITAGDIPASQLERLSRLLAYCQSVGIQVLVVYSPLPKEYEAPESEAFLTQIQPIVAQYGADIWDYSTQHDLHSHHHFYDHHHLNQAGVEIFNSTLITRLSNEGILNPDRFSSQTYE